MEVAIGPDGFAHAIFADNAGQATRAEYTRQIGGPVVKTNPTNPTCLEGIQLAAWFHEKRTARWETSMFNCRSLALSALNVELASLPLATTNSFSLSRILWSPSLMLMSHKGQAKCRVAPSVRIHASTS